MRTKQTETDAQPGGGMASRCARNLSPEVWPAAGRRPNALSTTSGPVVVAAVFCLVGLVMGTAFSFSTFAGELGRELKGGSGSISFIFGCAMSLLYGGGLFSGALADRMGTHRVAGAGALLAGGSLAAAAAVKTMWQADVALGLGFGLGLAVCYTPAVAAVQPWFDRKPRSCVWYRLVRHRGRYAPDAADREMADRRRGLAGSVHHHWGRGGRFGIRGLELDPASPRIASDIFVAVVRWLFSEARSRSDFSAALRGRVPVVSGAPRSDRSYDPSRRSRRHGPARCGMVGLDPRLRLSRRPADTRARCRPARTTADFGCASRCAGDAVCYLDNQGWLRHPGSFCVHLWGLLRSDHCVAPGGNRRSFRRAKFVCSDRPALHEFRARAARRSRSVRLFHRLLEQRSDCKLRGCGLLGPRRLFLCRKTASNSTTSNQHFPASIRPSEDAGLYRFLQLQAFGDVCRLRRGWPGRARP